VYSTPLGSRAADRVFILMEERTLSFVRESCGGRVLNETTPVMVRGVSTDSRSVEPGNLFVALSGSNFDAHDFLRDVCDKGAAAAVVEERRTAALPQGLPGVVVENARRALGQIGGAYRRQFDFSPIAVGGSNGKTSTKELIAAVLRQKMETLASVASFNNDVGVPLTLLALEKKHRAGVFEVGTNHPGEIRPLLEIIQPRIGIITSIGREHLEFFGTLDGVLAEEGNVAEVLPPTGLLVLNGETYGADRIEQRTGARVVRVGFRPENDWIISSVRIGEEGTHFTLSTEVEDFSGEYVTKLLGTHQVVNATYAVVVGRELGLGRAEIQRGLASCRGAKMRLQLRSIDEFLVLDDAYNANVDSMQAALETLRSFPCKGRRIAVLGEMGELGETSVSAHEEVGRRAAEGRVDCLVAVGKSSKIMAAAARGAGLRDVIDFAEVEKAGPAVTEMVRPGDVVLVKASRSTRIERVIEFLSAHFGSSEPCLAEG
jgi:UDP-N-acetylmuramoyl-tripeptide--D-alanyl-D-alanine ligase